jgi:hypothetical protein
LRLSEISWTVELNPFLRLSEISLIGELIPIPPFRERGIKEDLLLRSALFTSILVYIGYFRTTPIEEDLLLPRSNIRPNYNFRPRFLDKLKEKTLNTEMNEKRR